MTNFTNLINSLLEAKTLKGAKAQLGIAAGVAHVDLPKRISKKFLRIVAEENTAFSDDFIYEEVHYRGKTLPATHFWVDSEGFHHWDPDEARAYMVLKAADYRRIGGYKNKIYFNLLWKTIAEQEEEEAERKAEEAEEEKRFFCEEEEQKENVKYITLDESEEILNKAVEEVEAKSKEEPKFKVGELVRIRQWDDMEKEFGTDGYGSVACNYCFIYAMKPLCGKYAEIVSLDKDGRVALKFFNCDDLNTNWAYSTDMIEKV